MQGLISRKGVPLGNVPDYSCPICKTRLNKSVRAFRCTECKQDWRVTDGIPDFRIQADTYWGVYPEESMNRLVGRCRHIGFLPAVKEAFESSDPSFYDYIFDDSRANWHFVVPLEPEARVLDAGCGWGTLSFALAKHYGELVALDSCRQMLDLVSSRKQAEYPSGRNVTPVCGQLNCLPFPNGSFDLVVMNGVLEWVPFVEKDGDPVMLQLKALKEARRVLKKGGCLYCATENRWSAINFLGCRDTHSGLRFAPVLPRWLANLQSRLVRGKDFREYTHTIRQHRRMLKEAGFASSVFYAPLPSYRNFHYFLPLEDSRKIEFALRHLFYPRNNSQAFFIGLVKTFSLYKAVKHFVPDFGYTAFA